VNHLHRLYNFDRDVLEAIDRAGEMQRCELQDRSGWGRRSADAAVHKLYKNELIYKTCNKYRLTDRGKIALALVRGKERRARAEFESILHRIAA